MAVSLVDSIFYIFAGIATLSAIMVVMAKNPVRSVLSLVLTFVATAGCWLLTEAEFLAITLILVYVGAVLVLFLFIVMMLDIETSSLRAKFIRYLPFGIVVALLTIFILAYVLGPEKFGAGKQIISKAGENYSNAKALGMALYENYLLEVEIAAIILLAAMVAAISLTFRGAVARKSQQVYKQVKVKKSDRLKIIDMPFSNQAKKGD